MLFFRFNHCSLHNARTQCAPAPTEERLSNTQHLIAGEILSFLSLRHALRRAPTDGCGFVCCFVHLPHSVWASFLVRGRNIRILAAPINTFFESFFILINLQQKKTEHQSRYPLYQNRCPVMATNAIFDTGCIGLQSCIVNVGLHLLCNR